MQSNNPIFRRSEEFQRGGGAPYGGTMTDPSQWSVGTPGGTGYAPPTTSAPMTLDSVVQKTARTLGVVSLAALAARPPTIAPAGAVAISPG